MKIQLLPSTFDEHGRASLEQRLTCLLIDDRVAVDAGSLALAATDEQRERIRDCVITHAHIDHVASLPIFIDDLFATLDEPVRVHATKETIGSLERDIFNWTVYPRFSELRNQTTNVMQYEEITVRQTFRAAHLEITAVAVNHVVPTVGLIITDGATTIAFTSDTAATEEFWELVNRLPKLDALLIECSFPNSMRGLAEVSKHLTPEMVGTELEKLTKHDPQILAVHLKPAYREQLIEELDALNQPKLTAMEAGREYEW